MCKRLKTGVLVSVCLAAVMAGNAETVTVRPRDTGDALINPGMGLVHYHYSNRLWAYGVGSNPGEVDPLPGTSVVYLRVLWSDIEPREGEFRWDVFDSVAQNWIRAGKQMAIRIICCNQTVNATPDWVREAGCKGIWFKYRSETAQPRWEPVYDDPYVQTLEGGDRPACASPYRPAPEIPAEHVSCDIR